MLSILDHKSQNLEIASSEFCTVERKFFAVTAFNQTIFSAQNYPCLKAGIVNKPSVSVSATLLDNFEAVR